MSKMKKYKLLFLKWQQSFMVSSLCVCVCVRERERECMPDKVTVEQIDGF